MPYGIRWAIVQWQDPGFWYQLCRFESCWPSHIFETKPPSGGFLLPCRMQRVRTDEVKSRKENVPVARFRDLPAGACAKGESARRARESCWPSHIIENETAFGRFFCRSASACPDFGAYAIHPWRGLSHRDDQPIAKMLQLGAIFCFWGSWAGLRTVLGVGYPTAC